MGQRLKKTPKKTFLKQTTFQSIGKVLKGIVIFGILFIMITTFFAGMKILDVAKNAPKVDLKKFTSYQTQSVILDDKGNEIDKVVTTEVRIPVKLSEVSQYMKDAVVATEDERFYQHLGVDYKRTIGVTIKEVVNKIIGSKGDRQGGSTITQQLVKSIFLTPKQDYTRKIQEMYIALQIEKSLSKDEILEVYLNNTFFGGRAYGVEAAARQYFSKSAKELTQIEAAYLAGVPKAPTTFYAFSRENLDNPKNYIDRTKVVLDQMERNSKVTSEKKKEYFKSLDNEGLPLKQTVLANDGTYNYEYFTRPLVDLIKSDLMEKYSLTEEEATERLNNGGLQIYSTMNKEFQDHTQEVLNNPDNFSFEEYTDTKGIIQPQAAAVIIDSTTGEVKTIVGGRGAKIAGGLNRASDPNFLRAVGSSIKPLTIYSAGIDKKLIDAGTVIDDSPLTLQQRKDYFYGDDTAKPEDPTKPANVERTFQGLTTIREGMKRSSNLVSIKTHLKIGPAVSKEYAEKYGLILPPDGYAGTSMYALGQFPNIEGKDGGNPLIMANAFTTFANQGLKNDPMFYTKVIDSNGNVLLENKPKPKQIIQKGTAYIMWDMLKETAKDYAPNAIFGDIPVAGKTGTTEDNKELWYVGTTPYYSCALFVGTDDHQTIIDVDTGENLTSTKAVTGTWGTIMKTIHKGLMPKELEIPDDITKVEISKDSGNLPTNATKLDPRGDRIYNEWFFKDRVPTTKDTVHVMYNGRSYITRNYKPEVPLDDDKYVLPTWATPNNNNNNNSPAKPAAPSKPSTSTSTIAPVVTTTTAKPDATSTEAATTTTIPITTTTVPKTTMTIPPPTTTAPIISKPKPPGNNP